MTLSAQDRLDLILGRAIRRAEVLAVRVEELEAAAKAATKPKTERQTKPK